MLTFYGIRFNKQGTPERFNFSFDLRESLNAGLYIYDCFEKSSVRTNEAIEQEINNLFRGSRSQKSTNKLFRLNVAKWFRTRDIVRFVCPELPESNDHRLKIARILNTPESIEDKWSVIEAILIDFLRQKSAQDRDCEFASQESELSLTLQMVKLFFLEQDEEMPPANLEMRFVRNQFPKVIWKKKDGFSASSNPFWSPKNPFCAESYLLTQVMSGYTRLMNSGGGGATLQLQEQKVSTPQDLKDSGSNVVEGLSFSHMFPDGEPDSVRIEFESQSDSEEQLSLLPETAAETLLSLQKIAQKQFAYDGVKHLLAIFRQITMSAKSQVCDFDVDNHFNLVTKVSRTGQCSAKQRSVFKGVFDLLRRLRVKRVWSDGQEEKVITNPFILEIGTESNSTKGKSPKTKLLLDPIFAPSRQNPFRLGHHLALVPDEVFRESVYKHPLLPGLVSYITGSWLNAFAGEKSESRFSTRDIVEGSGLNVSASAKYRMPAKIKSELAYLKEKCYIAGYTTDKDDAGNPWNDRHKVSASQNVIEAIEKTTCLLTKQHMERLIA